MFFKKVYYKLRLDRISICWNKLASAIVRRFWKPLKIMTPFETVDYIINNKCSIARFGDGELSIMAYCISIGFQKSDKQLQKKAQASVE